MKTLLFFLLVSSQAYAMGFIKIPPADKLALEAKVKSELKVSSVTAQLARLGGDGLSSYNLLFGKLNQSDFLKIKSYYLSDIQYSASKAYELIDFLLPKMQAQVEKNFEAVEDIPGTESLGGREAVAANLSMNCWSTAYDVLRSDKDPLVSYLYMNPDDVSVAATLRDNKFSKSVKVNELEPNDYILYLIKDAKGNFGIDHVAVSLGLGLVFEKTGPTRIDYSQISLLKSVTNQRISLNAGVKVIVEYRRLIKSLPHPIQLWGAKALGKLTSAEMNVFPASMLDQIAIDYESEMGRTYNRIRPLKIVRSASGRYSLDPKDPVSEELRGSSMAGIISNGGKGYAEDLKSVVCKVSMQLLVNVESASGDWFKVRPAKFQIIDEAKCLDSKGKKVNSFWIPTKNLKPFH